MIKIKISFASYDVSMTYDCFMSASNYMHFFSTFIGITSSVWSNAEMDRTQIVLPCYADAMQADTEGCCGETP